MEGPHGYRKFYKSRAEQVMKPINVELTMGHDIGLSESYYKPTEHELLTDYLKAIPYLSINDDNAIDIKSLREEQQILVKKAENKDKELEQLRQEQQKMKEMMKAISAVLARVDNQMKGDNDQMRQVVEEMEKEGEGA
jgi:hypothetical protein